MVKEYRRKKVFRYRGNSLSRLYVAILARALMAQDPSLADEMSDYLECCGVGHAAIITKAEQRVGKPNHFDPRER